MAPLTKQTSLRSNTREVFGDYGGWRTLFASGYLWIALVLTVFVWPDYDVGKWAEFTVSIVPTILGLTLAGAAILTTIGGDSFRERLAQLGSAPNEQAPILELLSNFIFAMLVQLIALVYAIIFQTKPFPTSWFVARGVHAALFDWTNFALGAIGSLLLFYGLLLVLGAAFSVRALATVYVLDARREATPPPAPGAPPAAAPPSITPTNH